MRCTKANAPPNKQKHHSVLEMKALLNLQLLISFPTHLMKSKLNTILRFSMQLFEKAAGCFCTCFLKQHTS
jgi:hypothetical protein